MIVLDGIALGFGRGVGRFHTVKLTMNKNFWNRAFP